MSDNNKNNDILQLWKDALASGKMSRKEQFVASAVIENWGNSLITYCSENNLNYKTFTKDISRVRKRFGIPAYAASRVGTNRENIPPMVLKGKSTLRDAEGNVVLEWTKESPKENNLLSGIREALDEFKKLELIHVDSSMPRALSNNPLLGQITIADYHLGMFADEDETGIEWNTEIASQALYRYIDNMVDLMMPCHTGVINMLGDFFHSDSEVAVTPKSGHILDQDSRYHRLIRIAIRAMHYAIEKMKTKCQVVRLIVSQGNHDPIGSMWLNEAFAFYYREDESVIIDCNASPFTCIEFGETMLVYHHGHKVRFENIGQIVPSLFPEQWGRTKYRYVHVGHRHHRHIKDQYGITVEQHQTMAPADAYSANLGYRSERGANVIIYSAEHGEMTRCTIRPLV